MIQRRFPSTPARHLKTLQTRPATRVSTGTAGANRRAIKPLPKPSKPLIHSQAEFTPQPAVELPSSRKPVYKQMTAVPREINPTLSDAPETSQTDLNASRGVFTGRVRQRIAQSKYYPGIARRRGMEGQPVIAFTLSRSGRLTEIELAQTSGYQLLDQAALEAVQQAEPYPEIPAELNTDSFQFKLPISFVLK